MLAIYGNVPGLLLSAPLIAHFSYPITATLYCVFGVAFTLLIAVRWRAHLWRLEAPANIDEDRKRLSPAPTNLRRMCFSSALRGVECTLVGDEHGFPSFSWRKPGFGAILLGSGKTEQVLSPSRRGQYDRAEMGKRMDTDARRRRRAARKCIRASRCV